METYREAMLAARRDYLKRALVEAHGKADAVALIADIHRSDVYRYLKDFPDLTAKYLFKSKHSPKKYQVFALGPETTARCMSELRRSVAI